MFRVLRNLDGWDPGCSGRNRLASGNREGEPEASGLPQHNSAYVDNINSKEPKELAVERTPSLLERGPAPTGVSPQVLLRVALLGTRQSSEP